MFLYLILKTNVKKARVLRTKEKRDSGPFLAEKEVGKNGGEEGRANSFKVIRPLGICDNWNAECGIYNARGEGVCMRGS